MRQHVIVLMCKLNLHCQCIEIKLLPIKISLFFFGKTISNFLLFWLVFQVGDYKEGYYIGVEVDEDDPESNKPFYGPNKWPAPGKELKNLPLEEKYDFYEISILFGFIILLIFSVLCWCVDILPGWRETMEKFHREAL